MDRSAPLLEAPENARAELVVDSDAGIAHADLDARGFLHERDVDAATARRELDRVGNEVRDHPIERRGINRDHRPPGPVEGELHTERFCGRPERSDHLLEQRNHVASSHRELEPAFLARGEKEERVDEAKKPARGALDRIEPSARVGVDRPAQPLLEVGHGEHHERERRPDLVIDVGEQLVARPLGLFELPDRLRELRRSLLDLAFERGIQLVETALRFLELFVANDERFMGVLEVLRGAAQREWLCNCAPRAMKHAAFLRNADVVTNARRNLMHRHFRLRETQKRRELGKDTSRNEEELGAGRVPGRKRQLEPGVALVDGRVGVLDAAEEVVATAALLAGRPAIEIGGSEEQTRWSEDRSHERRSKKDGAQRQELVLRPEVSGVLHEADERRPFDPLVLVLEVLDGILGSGRETRRVDRALLRRAKEHVECPAGDLPH